MSNKCTYVDASFSATKVTIDVEGVSEFPFVLGLLNFGGTGEVDFPAISIVSHTLAGEGHLVVGKTVGRRAVTVVDLQRAGILVGFGVGFVLPLALGLLRYGEVLK